MSRIRIEGLLATFPKLVGIGKQHTYVETDNVRYVYQPMESLYLLLVTNKQSNILEDRDTLQLLSKLVSALIDSLSLFFEYHRSILVSVLLIMFSMELSCGLDRNVTLSVLLY